MLEKRMINGNSHDRLDLNDYFTTITIESVAASSSSYSLSFETPCKLLPSSPPPHSPASVGVGGGGVSYIEHLVSKFDTLAGVAIKYGVEVADIKKMNGLLTDHQMFSLKTLQLPLPGRHPPSPILANGVDNIRLSSWERTPPGGRYSDFFDSFQSLKLKSSSQPKLSHATSSSQGYYGLKNPAEAKVHPDGFEMAVYSIEGSLENGTSTKSATPLILPLCLPRKCKSVANGFYSDNDNLSTQEAKDNNLGGAGGLIYREICSEKTKFGDRPHFRCSRYTAERRKQHW